MAEQRIISADSHFVEPPAMWAEPVDARFRDRAPHTQQGYKGRPGEWFTCEKHSAGPGSWVLRLGKSSEEFLST